MLKVFFSYLNAKKPLNTDSSIFNFPDVKHNYFVCVSNVQKLLDIQSLYLEIQFFYTENGWDELWVYDGEGKQ